MPPPEGVGALGLGGTVVIDAEVVRTARERIETAIAAARPPAEPLELDVDRSDRTLIGDIGGRTMIGAVDMSAHAVEPYVINAIVDAPVSSRSFSSSVPPAAQYAEMVSRAMRSSPPPSRRRVVAMAALGAALLAALVVLFMATR